MEKTVYPTSYPKRNAHKLLCAVVFVFISSFLGVSASQVIWEAYPPGNGAAAGGGAMLGYLRDSVATSTVSLGAVTWYGTASNVDFYVCGVNDRNYPSCNVVFYAASSTIANQTGLNYGENEQYQLNANVSLPSGNDYAVWLVGGNYPYANTGYRTSFLSTAHEYEAVGSDTGNYYTNIIPQNGTTTPTTAVQISFHYEYPTASTTEIDIIVTNTLNPTQSGQSDPFFGIYPTNGSYSGDVATSTTLSEGSYALTIGAYDANTGVNRYTLSSPIYFNVISNIYASTTGLAYPYATASTTALTQINCTMFDFGCQVQKAVTFLFYPSNTATGNWTNLKNALINKPPFGYVGGVQSLASSISANATPVFTLSQENNIMTDIFAPMRAGLLWVVWVVFGIWLFKRVSNINV